MRPVVFLIALVLGSSLAHAQSDGGKMTIEKSIDSLYNRSSSWEFYKIVKKDRYLNLKKEILDTLAIYKKEIANQSSVIQIKNDSLKKSKEVIDILSGELNQAIASKNEIKIVGVTLGKSTYQYIVWGIIGVLIVVLVYFIVKFNQSHVVTKNAQSELELLEEEFAAHKKKAMTKEQKLRRQLQDEINKQRGV